MPALQQLTDRAKKTLEAARRRFPPLDIAVTTFQRFGVDDGGSYAAALTYYTFFSIFPLMLFGASLLGYLTADNPELRNDLIKRGSDAVPILRDALSPDGLKTLAENSGGVALTGLVMALYSGSGAVVALEHALNKFHKLEKEPGWLQKRLRSLRWLAVLGVLGLLAVGAGGVASFAETWLEQIPGATWVITAAAAALAVVINTLVFATAYKFLPAVRRSWREVIPGAVVAGVLFQALNIGGTAYLARGQTARNDTFGTFAAAATLLVASYLIAQITLLAAEVNIVLAERRTKRRSSAAKDQGGERMSQVPTTEESYSSNGHTGKSAGQLMKEVTEDLSTLIRKEIELAKQEVGASVSAKLKGVAIISIAGALGFFALIFLLLAIRDGLDNFLWTWLADIGTAVILLILGGLGAMAAKKKLTAPLKTDLTKQTIKEDVEWAKTLGKR